MDIVIGGEDEIAIRLGNALVADHSITIIGPEELTDLLTDSSDLNVIQGNISSQAVLEEANVGAAKLFIACTSSDERNLVACITAKQLGARRATCFMFRRDVNSSEKEAATLARKLGIDNVILPPERLAKEIIQTVTLPGALEVEAFEGGRVRLMRRAVEEDTPIIQAPIKEIGLPSGVVLVMARRGEETFIPNGNTQLAPGDQITAMGTSSGINSLVYRYLRPTNAGRFNRRATVIGGGTVGFDVAEGLINAGWDVKVIDADSKRCEVIDNKLKKALVLCFDGADLDRLNEEEISESSVLVAVTSNDEKNLMISLLGKHLGVPRIITRADKLINERLFEKVGIDVVLSSRGAAITSVVRNVLSSQTDLVAEFEHGDVIVLRLDVPAHRQPTPLPEMHAPGSAIIGAILRDGKVIIPHGNDHVVGSDRLMVFCSRQDEQETRHYFQRFEL